MPSETSAGRARGTSRSARSGRRSFFEPLEQRRLLSAMPAPFPAAHGPQPLYAYPTEPTVPPGSPPVAALVLDADPAMGAESFTFRVIYRDDVAIRAGSIDLNDIRIAGPGGYRRNPVEVRLKASEQSREADLEDGAQDGPELTALYTVAAPDGSWDSADAGRYQIHLRDDQVSDVHGLTARGGMLGEFSMSDEAKPPPTEPPDEPPPDTRTSAQFPPIGANVRDFGAIPNDGLDDTDAIQAAIDSLPDAYGAPGYVPTGGVVFLPSGTYHITGSLVMHSGITLRGAGHDSVVRDVSTDRNHPAILLNSPFVHRQNIGAAIENLTIYTDWARGIGIDPNMGHDMLDFRVSRVRISAAGAAIDLRHQAVYHSDFEDVEVFNPGSTALHLGRINDGHGAVNRIRNFRVTGTARPGFVKETALVYIHNDLYIDGMTIETAGANTLPLYLRGQMTLDGLNLALPTSSVPGGIAVHLDRVTYAIMDRAANVGLGRRLLLTQANDVQIANLVSDGSSPWLSQLSILDAASSLRVGNSAGGYVYAVTIPPEPARDPVGYSTRVIDPAAFGVRANDGVDDSAALQRAVDSLVGSGAGGLASLPGGDGGSNSADPPKGHDAIGGIVQLPHGIINLSTPIKLPSGVWLRGYQNGTTLENKVAGVGRAVIELTSRDSSRGNFGAAVTDLVISTNTTGRAAGIRADATVVEVRDLQLRGLRLTTGGPAIDLRTVTVNHATLERIVVNDPGSTALWLGKTDNSSTGNLVRGLRMMGSARPNFVAERALVVLHGQQTRVESGAIEETFTNLLPFYASGSLEMVGLYMEYPIQPDSIGFVFDNLRDSYIDNLTHVSPYRRVVLLNGSDVNFGMLNISGFTVPLADCILLDGTSRLTLNAVRAQFDPGLIDHPRVAIKGAFNIKSNRFVDTFAAFAGNYVADPNMTDVADNRVANWEIFWGDNNGAIVGTWAVETVGGQKRLRLTVLSNSNNRQISVRVNLNVPSSAVGNPGIARWRIDAPAGKEAFVWRRYYAQQYLGRVLNSQTAVASPASVAADEQLWIDLPQASGTYYLWKVGMVAV